MRVSNHRTHLRVSDKLEWDCFQALLLSHNRPVPPIVHDNHVLAVVVIGLVLARGQVHNEGAVEPSRTLGPEVPMVEVRPRLRNHNSQSVISQTKQSSPPSNSPGMHRVTFDADNAISHPVDNKLVREALPI